MPIRLSEDFKIVRFTSISFGSLKFFGTYLIVNSEGAPHRMHTPGRRLNLPKSSVIVCRGHVPNDVLGNPNADPNSTFVELFTVHLGLLQHYSIGPSCGLTYECSAIM